MKKLFLVILVFVFVLCFVSCDTLLNAASISNNNISSDIDGDVHNNIEFDSISDDSICIWTDPDTGVQYIVYRFKAGYAGGAGITPRLNSDGTLYIIDK